jgi:hypothetical protein
MSAQGLADRGNRRGATIRTEDRNGKPQNVWVGAHCWHRRCHVVDQCKDVAQKERGAREWAKNQIGTVPTSARSPASCPATRGPPLATARDNGQ